MKCKHFVFVPKTVPIIYKLKIYKLLNKNIKLILYFYPRISAYYLRRAHVVVSAGNENL